MFSQTAKVATKPINNKIKKREKVKMKLNNNPITVGASVEIQHRFMKVLFTIISVAANGAAALAQLEGAKVAMSKSHPDYSTEQVIYQMPLSTLLEIAACNEGAITVEDIGGGNQKITGTVEFSDTGSIQPRPQEIYKLTVSGLVNTLSVDLNTIDVPTDALNQLQYKPFPVNANAPIPVNVFKSKWLCLPKASLTSVELQTDDVKITYTPAEIDQLVKEMNPLAVVNNGALTQGSKDLYCIPVGWAKRALITTNAVTNVIVVQDTDI